MSTLPERRRVVITGIGLVSPVGIGTSQTWDALMKGANGIAPITRIDASVFPTRIAGEVKGFDPSQFFHKKEVKKSDAFIQYAMAASQFALDDSGLVIDETNSSRVAVIIGAGIGGLPVIEKMHNVLLEKGPSRVSPFFIPALISNMAAGQVSIRFGARGPNACPSTACTSGLHAVGDAFRLIQHGYTDASFAGGAEGVITPLAFAGFCSMRALSTRNDEPEKASRPWDKDRDGFVVGEGAGILLLEELEQATSRGAKIYAEILGYGMSGDAFHISAPHPDGNGAAQVMEAVIADAGIEREQVDYINAHGTSTERGDVAEVRAIKRVFGEHAYRLAISSTKSSTGHLLGAAGGLEAGIVALALTHQKLPATLNLDEPDEECDLDFVPKTPREAPIEIAVTNSFGFGGTNGALVMRRYRE